MAVASYCLHTGEEPPISGTRGSGAIFFARCTMRCIYCQNYPISQLGHGNVTEVEELAYMMGELERRGAHNINLVTPTHYLPQIARALDAARRRGLRLPVVMNTSGYENADTIRMLEGLVQIYLVDMRYSSPETADLYSGAPDYPVRNREAVSEMLRQAGPLVCRNGLAVSGVIIRHLLLPGLMDETVEILDYIAAELPAEVPVSLMSQYFPAHLAATHPVLGRRVTEGEVETAVAHLKRLKLTAGWVQEDTRPVRPVA
jgi:putative pyruvate formate lyase activating enzyme